MDNDVKTWLFDILTAINEIESYYIGVPKMFETLKTTSEPSALLNETSKSLARQLAEF